MKFYSGWEWLLIDAASKFGLDKLTFEERIAWTTENLSRLETLEGDKKERPLYLKAVMALRKAQKGIPTGHRVGVDAVCSGVQLLSVLAGCIDGARATGLIDPDTRADAYSEVTRTMQQLLGSSFSVDRSDAKKATMTAYYGSTKTPESIFGKDTVELEAFHEASKIVAPGAYELRAVLKAAWQPWELAHDWILPDGYKAHVKVMEKITSRIEIQELGGSSFTYEYQENKGSEFGLSLIANTTHSVDAYVLRCMYRRCNYNKEMVLNARDIIQIELIGRQLNQSKEQGVPQGKVKYYLDQYNRSGIADIVILPYLNLENVVWCSLDHLHKLMEIINGMLQYEPFELVCVHDEFTAHANNINWVRWQYKEILADIADSELIDDILTQIHGVPTQFNQLGRIGHLIRDSNYALC